MLSLIAAIARNRVIGNDNQLLWHLPGDMRHFRETTRGKPVIMGRKTWESLPEKFRPLPGRLNIVVSRNPAYAAPGATLATSLEDALKQVKDADEAFVIGGADLYRQALPFAERLYLTELTADFEGDTSFPEMPPEDWKETSRSQPVEENGLAYTFVVYQQTKLHLATGSKRP